MKFTRAGIFFGFFLMVWLCACSSEADKKMATMAVPELSKTIPLEWKGIPLKPSLNRFKKLQQPSEYDNFIKRTFSETKIYSYFRTVNTSKNKAYNYSENVEYNYPSVDNSKSEKESVRYLNLSRKGLNAIPAEIATMKTLKDLQLSENSISSLGMHLFFCNGLKKLDLSSNLISYIPPDISYLFNLEELILRDNRLNNLPGNFSELRNLKTLDLSNMHRSFSRAYNNFEFIPQSVCMLPKLEKLLLEKLPILYIPVNIVFLKNLKILSLNGCNKVSVFNAIRILAQLPELQVLDISFTGTTLLPNDIINLKKLKVLIWQEEGGINQAEVARIREMMPDTKIYTGAESRPFLRGNSLNTILNGY